MIPQQTLEQFNSYRKESDRHLLCHAPFSTINFEQNGNMTACCYNRSDILGKYPKQSIKKAWNSKITREFRKNTTRKTLSKGCFLCEKTILEKSYKKTKAILYDQHSITANEHKKI